QATRFFVDAQRSGVLELMLSTPLTSDQIIRGQWRALLRLLGAPVILCVAAQAFSAFLSQEMIWANVPATTPTAMTRATNSTPANTGPGPTGVTNTTSVPNSAFNRPPQAMIW